MPKIFEELNWFQIWSSRRQVADLTFLNKLLGSHLGFPALLDRVNQQTPSCTRSQRLFEVGHQFRSYVCPEAFPVQGRELHIGRLLLQLYLGAIRRAASGTLTPARCSCFVWKLCQFGHPMVSGLSDFAVRFVLISFKWIILYLIL